jgi:tRNA modification GTPase
MVWISALRPLQRVTSAIRRQSSKNKQVRIREILSGLAATTWNHARRRSVDIPAFHPVSSDPRRHLIGPVTVESRSMSAAAPADTIFALSTPPGRSAIAVVRLSGPAVPDVLTALVGRLPPPRRATLRAIVDPDTGALLDRGLVLRFLAPASETGEDMAELQLHGSPAVVAAVLACLGRRPGCRPAEPGEFTRRALMAGKLDLAQVEGLADLIDADTEAQRRQGLDALTGTHSAAYGRLRNEIIFALGLAEASIDFAEEGDIATGIEVEADAAAHHAQRTLTEVLAGRRGEIVREGYRVVLAGPPNAGKSSLLNALARRDVAIVSAEAGTTRDVIEARLDLDGMVVVVSDTAGVRETASVVEREGIRRALAAAARANLVLWLIEPGGPAVPPVEVAAAAKESKAVILQVATKIDVETLSDSHNQLIHVKHSTKYKTMSGIAHRVSAVTGDGLDTLVADIAARARKAASPQAHEAPITRARHRREIERALEHVSAYVADRNAPAEVRIEALRQAVNAVGRLTGHIGADDVLGQIFSRFCIGK